MNVLAHLGGIPEIAGSVGAIAALLVLVWYGTRKSAEADEQDAEK